MRILDHIKGKLGILGDRLRKESQLAVIRKRLQKNSTNGRIVLFQTPAHSNIGDHAIAKAELDFLRSVCNDREVIEINQSVHHLFLLKGKNLVRKQDIIMLHGGGNFGNQYMLEERIRRSVVQAFPANKIILFPQTMFYTNDQEGTAALSMTKDIMETHAKVVLVARERCSFDLMKSHFPKIKVIMTPDIVLSMEPLKSAYERSGILLVLRNDEERILSKQQQESLSELACRHTREIRYTDMHHRKGISNVMERNKVLSAKFEQFSQARLVITDRLHGMVFAAITGTPCIAFANYNHKVSGTYEWIKHLNYIRFISFEDDLAEEIASLYDLAEKTDFDPSIYKEYYQQLIDEIHE